MRVTELPSMLFRKVFPLLLAASAVQAEDLVDDDGVELVRAHCVACHSLQLVTQHRMSHDGWLETIRYMQKNHNLWPLGEHEGPLLDYLSRNYGPQSSARARRSNLPYYLEP